MKQLLALLIPQLGQLISLVMNSVNTAEHSGELTAAEAQAHRDNLDRIWSQEYAKTDAQRGRV